MTQSDKIITAARHYCLGLLDGSLSMPYHIATGLLYGVEYLVGKQYSDIESLKADIKQLALASLKEKTIHHTRDGHLKRIEQGKQNFLQFIDEMDALNLGNIEPLPYRRRLSEKRSNFN